MQQGLFASSRTRYYTWSSKAGWTGTLLFIAKSRIHIRPIYETTGRRRSVHRPVVRPIYETIGKRGSFTQTNRNTHRNYKKVPMTLRSIPGAGGAIAGIDAMAAACLTRSSTIWLMRSCSCFRFFSVSICVTWNLNVWSPVFEISSLNFDSRIFLASLSLRLRSCRGM